MNSEQFKAYLTEVLGWKMTPNLLIPHSLVPQTFEETVSNSQDSSSHISAAPRALFGVYVGDNPLSVAESELIAKMLKAIGQDQFQWVKSQQDLSQFEHVLDFSGEQISTSADTRIWGFAPTASYVEGTPDQINHHKKQAWEQLKHFRSEVLS